MERFIKSKSVLNIVILLLISGFIFPLIVGQDEDAFGTGEQDIDAVEEAELPTLPPVVNVPGWEKPDDKAEAKDSNYTQASFRMAARKLPKDNVDPFNGSPDPYVIVSRSKKTTTSNFTDWTQVLTTRTQVDNPDPNWVEVLTIRLVPGQKWKFDINDYDPIGSDDYIGQVILPAEDLINLNGDSLSRAILPQGSGVFIIYKFEE